MNANAAPHVLVVDDDRQLRTLVSRFLTEHGLRVTQAADGRELMSALEVGRFDIVVLDLMMPGEDGLSLCRRLRERNGPPVIIQLPEIRIQRVRTTVTVPDGGTLLLGGLRFFQEQRLDSSVPFLSDIPVISFFWSRQGTYIERRNLFILLKATIIRLEEHEPNFGRRG